ncbi:MAG: hypothetical protein U9Q98_05325 [Bacteroidota bacterium]|nr:hypothetical protein [Bacteroidota bacterium]
MNYYKEEDYIKYRITRARETIEEVCTHIEKRNKGDYNNFYDYDEETVLRLYPQTKAFIERIEEILKE